MEYKWLASLFAERSQVYGITISDDDSCIISTARVVGRREHCDDRREFFLPIPLVELITFLLHLMSSDDCTETLSLEQGLYRVLAEND